VRDSSFNSEERKALQEALAAARSPIACPRCGTDVSIGVPVAGGGTVHPVWYVRCDRCDVTVYVSDIPGPLRPKPGE
jgi:hypothetical protein